MSLRLSPNFTLHEMMRSNTGERLNVDNRATANDINRLVILSQYMERIREIFNRPIIVTSAFRSREINKLVGGAVNSDHLMGYAVDFKINSLSTVDICRSIYKSDLDYSQLIEEFGQWVHISINPANKRQNLKAFKRNGRTFYSYTNFED